VNAHHTTVFGVHIWTFHSKLVVLIIFLEHSDYTIIAVINIITCIIQTYQIHGISTINWTCVFDNYKVTDLWFVEDNVLSIHCVVGMVLHTWILINNYVDNTHMYIYIIKLYHIIPVRFRIKAVVTFFLHKITNYHIYA